MKFPIYIFIVSVLFAPHFSHAKWYWVSVPSNPSASYFIEGPNTIGNTSDSREVMTAISSGPSVITAVQTPVPDSFMVVMESIDDSQNCNDSLDSALSILRNYDSENEIVSGVSLKSSGWINEESYLGREKLISKILSDTEECLKDEQAQQKKEEQKAEYDRMKKEAEEVRLIEVRKAVSECDFDYFESEMSNSERMDTYKEREACKSKNTVAPPKIVEEIVPTTSVHTRQDVSNVINTPPAPKIVDTVVESSNQIEEDEASSTTSSTTTTADVSYGQSDIKTNETEINQNVTSVENLQPDEQKPSFFRRIINFFGSWFN